MCVAAGLCRPLTRAVHLMLEFEHSTPHARRPGHSDCAGSICAWVSSQMAHLQIPPPSLPLAPHPSMSAGSSASFAFSTTFLPKNTPKIAVQTSGPSRYSLSSDFASSRSASATCHEMESIKILYMQLEQTEALSTDPIEELVRNAIDNGLDYRQATTSESPPRAALTIRRHKSLPWLPLLLLCIAGTGVSRPCYL